MRERLFLFLLILGFGILLVRLFTLQILQGEYYRKLAEGNRIRTTKIPALRGVIYDRTGEVLVRNTPEGREYIYGPALAQVLGYIGEISQEELNSCESSPDAIWKTSPDSKDARDRFSKSLLPPEGSSDTILMSFCESNSRSNICSSINDNGARIEKAHIGTGWKHVTMDGLDRGRHKIDQTHLSNCFYSAGDIIGKIGIEKAYDLLLRGQDGGILEEVDAAGKVARKLGERKPLEGENLKLNIDLALQKKVFEILNKEKKAVAVATDPLNGEVLALVSIPSFDPNLFTLKQAQSSKLKVQSEMEKIFNDENQPMFNRAIGGQYPPGSLFKIVTAIAGLEEGKLNSKTTVEDTGQITVGRWTFGNWYYRQYGKIEGWLDVVGAFKRSNDIFFYRVGEWLGIDKLSSWAGRFGLGKISGIDLPGEAEGLVPTKDWKKNYKNEDWFLGDDFITAIGQGDLLTTPLQVNLMTSVIANGGSLCRPKLVKNLESGIWNLECEDLRIKKENLELVKEGMKGACDTGGTGWPFFKFKIKNEKLKIDDENFFGPEASDSADTVYVPVACKTGTAEAPGKETKAHAWFTVFAPIADPEIVLTVLVENGGEGSSVAGPIAKEILKWWFEQGKE